MFSNNASLIPLPSAPEGDLSFQDSSFYPPPPRKSLILIIETPHDASSALPKRTCRGVDKVAVCLCGAERKKSFILFYFFNPQNHPYRPHQSQEEKNIPLQTVPVCWNSADLHDPWEMLTSYPGHHVRRSPKAGQAIIPLWWGRALPLHRAEGFGGEAPIARLTHQPGKISHLPQDWPPNQDWQKAAGRMSCTSTKPRAWMHLAPAPLTCPTWTSSRMAESSSISFLRTEDQSGFNCPTSSWSCHCFPQ